MTDNKIELRILDSTQISKRGHDIFNDWVDNKRYKHPPTVCFWDFQEDTELTRDEVLDLVVLFWGDNEYKLFGTNSNAADTITARREAQIKADRAAMTPQEKRYFAKNKDKFIRKANGLNEVSENDLN